MPSYQVIRPGFIEGKLYDPDGKRPVYNTDKTLKKVPSWLKPIAKAAVKRVVKAAADKVKKGRNPPIDEKVEKDSVTFIDTPSQVTEKL